MFKWTNANRILLAAIAALILGISMPEVSYASTGCVSAETELPKRERNDVSTNTHPAEETVITVFRTAELPVADDRTEESRTYIQAASGERSERSVSLKKLNVLFTEKAYRQVERAREKDADSSRTFFFNYLSIIQYIHSQDGSKG